MRIHLQQTLVVDEEAWALDYGLEAKDVAADVMSHLPDLVAELITETAGQLGTFHLDRRAAHDLTVAAVDGRVEGVKLVPKLPQPVSGFRDTGVAGVLLARWDSTNWRTLIKYDDGWDVTGPPYRTIGEGVAAAAQVASTAY